MLPACLNMHHAYGKAAGEIEVHCCSHIVLTASQQLAYGMAAGVYSWVEQAACMLGVTGTRTIHGNAQ